jgi:NitT/TauT family transport system permease protein
MSTSTSRTDTVRRPAAESPSAGDHTPRRGGAPERAAAERVVTERRRRRRARLGVGVRRTLAGALLLGVWEALVWAGALDPFTAPPPTEIARVLAGVFGDGSIYPHIEATFTAALLGLALGMAVGALLGTIAALVRPVAELIEPVMVLLSAVPRVVFAPLLIIWLGIGISSKVALSFLLVAVLVFFAVYGGILDTDRRLVDRIRTFGGGTRVLLREVYVPAITGRVLGNLKIAVGFAFTGAVVGEFVASARGLGYLLMFAQTSYNAALVFALITLIMVFVLVLFALTGVLERRVLRWQVR